ncbi:hypothetical protein P175DRAFT_0554437 [Aspergillus ochraceoroseus IBT 24754]|uniref:Methylated-DNA--protein-cysteine methyltransferase n=1 Tax=Aspergillus ochraceoroseus IBT 24754 TaxID=1392256 RepID=A0A2T5M9H9_9EURO|nr:uncharacterized protein P175DRAFT_0554437 [Aspergillus ochraceoroseus IBT 24754]PTU25190.1 hypothetical protein P175DRAFT_0554437 [Aspergillus ochraceoroseus IBT 24754]
MASNPTLQRKQHKETAQSARGANPSYATSHRPTPVVLEDNNNNKNKNKNLLLEDEANDDANDPLSGPHEEESPQQPSLVSTTTTTSSSSITVAFQEDNNARQQFFTRHKPTTPDQPTSHPPELIKKNLHRISRHPTLTPYRRRTYRALLSVPPGQWTTYAALARHLRSSARAVGAAMRTNPFAPEVPCHRVLGRDGSLGGYMGSSPSSKRGSKDERNLELKRKLLEREGVRFDNGGKAMGRGFVEFRDL